MSRIPASPRIYISLSIPEVIALSFMLKSGTMFTRPKERKRVEAVLSRVGKKLAALGLPQKAIDILVEL